jgi:hypothetical protein
MLGENCDCRGPVVIAIPELHLGRPAVLGPLTVFPVWTGASMAPHLVTGDAATIKVTEQKPDPVVAELVLTNVGVQSALLVEGELLEGGWQHRVLVNDVVIGCRRDSGGCGGMRGSGPVARSQRPCPSLPQRFSPRPGGAQRRRQAQSTAGGMGARSRVWRNPWLLSQLLIRRPPRPARVCNPRRVRTRWGSGAFSDRCPGRWE